jgi:hypothetical protein
MTLVFFSARSPSSVLKKKLHEPDDGRSEFGQEDGSDQQHFFGELTDFYLGSFLASRTDMVQYDA